MSEGTSSTYLLYGMRSDVARQRINDLSNFLRKYVQRQLSSHDLDIRNFAQAQQWTAMVATEPVKAAHSIALTLSKLDPNDRAEFARMESIIEAFAVPSTEFNQ